MSIKRIRQMPVYLSHYMCQCLLWVLFIPDFSISVRHTTMFRILILFLQHKVCIISIIYSVQMSKKKKKLFE